MAAKSQTIPDPAPAPIVAPGVDDITKLARGIGLALFIKGVEAFTTVTGPTLTIADSQGGTVEANLLGAEPGRLFALAQRFQAQSTSSMSGTLQPMNTSFQDITLFNALEAAYGKEALDPRTAYTVLVIQIP